MGIIRGIKGEEEFCYFRTEFKDYVGGDMVGKISWRDMIPWGKNLRSNYMQVFSAL